MYYFSKRFSRQIKCLDCNGNYRGITERGKKKYYCSTYHNRRTCTRWKVDEEYLIELILNHYEITLLKSGTVESTPKKKIDKPTIDLETLLNRVEGIEVSPKDKTLRINFLDGTSVLIEPSHHAFYME